MVGHVVAPLPRSPASGAYCVDRTPEIRCVATVMMQASLLHQLLDSIQVKPFLETFELLLDASELEPILFRETILACMLPLI